MFIRNENKNDYAAVFALKGIGSRLIRAGLEQCVELDYGAVVVLGHPDYYPRFGFVPASNPGIKCEYEVPEEAFMIIEIEPGYLQNVSGIIRYMMFNNW